MSVERILWLNQKKCTGCNLCRLACSYGKAKEYNLSFSRIGLSDEDEYGFYQTICRNCEEAPCMDACPAGAIYKKDDSNVVLDESKCVSCNMCIMVCPFNAIGTTKKFNYKCDGCNGKELCAQVCYHDSVKFGSYKKLIEDKRRLVLDRIKQP